METKEKHDEEALRKANLTHEEAKRLYDESAALIRAIMDLRDLEAVKSKTQQTHLLQLGTPPLLRIGGAYRLMDARERPSL